MNRPATRIVLTLLLALAAALLCAALHTPVPWMVGPLLSTALLAMTGGPAASATPLRNTGQWVIGGALGLYFTPQVLDMLLGLWWVISLGILWALVLGFLAGAFLYSLPARPGLIYIPGVRRLTTPFSFTKGRGCGMTIVGESFAGRSGAA